MPLKSLSFRLISWVAAVLVGTALPLHAEERHYLAPSRVADYIHSVIEADRTIYSEYIVERLNETINLPATETWEENDTLPLPAQFLLAAARSVEDHDSGLKYRLMSLWPINPRNGPRQEKEKEGLEQIARNPEQPFTWITQREGKTLFHAIYPDRAVTKSCVQCHNNHPKSSRRDFKKDDVMGGILISFPVTRREPAPGSLILGVAPEVAADFVHAVLEADRSFYSSQIVNRLQSKKIIYASEHWWEENTLLLPAQFLLNASELIRHRKLGLDFKLISLWPINPHNGPANKFESVGLEEVTANPLRPYIGMTSVGNRAYFQAIYPDIAVTPACVSCHNTHPRSPKHDFKLFDVLGGIVVSLPLTQD